MGFNSVFKGLNTLITADSRPTDRRQFLTPDTFWEPDLYPFSRLMVHTEPRVQKQLLINIPSEFEPLNMTPETNQISETSL